ncbi:MAG: hypothetical protein RL154_932 [Pseudomonadota bacterium]|jgi:ABC-type multidrug transport system permease subunit
MWYFWGEKTANETQMKIKTFLVFIVPVCLSIQILIGYTIFSFNAEAQKYLNMLNLLIQNFGVFELMIGANPYSPTFKVLLGLVANKALIFFFVVCQRGLLRLKWLNGLALKAKKL